MPFFGNYPKDEKVRDKFEQSGFFNFVTGYVNERNRNSKTTIYTENHKKVLADLTDKIVEDAARTVFGNNLGSEIVQRFFIETMCTVSYLMQ